MNRSEMRKILKQVAKKNNVSVAEVEQEMQIAINSAYNTPNEAAKAIPREGKVPTSQEFIRHVALKVNTEQQNQNHNTIKE